MLVIGPTAAKVLIMASLLGHYAHGGQQGRDGVPLWAYLGIVTEVMT